MEEGAPPSAPQPAFPFPAIDRHNLNYAAAILPSKGVAFPLLPVYTRYLTPADYGILELVVMTMEVLALTAGLPARPRDRPLLSPGGDGEGRALVDTCRPRRCICPCPSTPGDVQRRQAIGRARTRRG
jgi:hypothetical protein